MRASTTTNTARGAMVLLSIAISTEFAARPSRAASPVRVMTYNIRYDGGLQEVKRGEAPWQSTDQPERRTMAVKLLRSAELDLFGLQEVLPNQLDYLRSELEPYTFYSVGRDDGKRQGEHCTIGYRRDRFEALDQGTFWLCETPDVAGSRHADAACPRIASWVKLRDNENDDRPLLVVNTHWDHVGQLSREFAADAITSRLPQLAGGAAVIVMGDLNTGPSTVAIRRLLEDSKVDLVDSYRKVHPQRGDREGTFNAFAGKNGGARIDYIFATPGLEPQSAEIVRTSFDGLYPSDHYPVVVEFR